MSKSTYNIHESYDINYEHGPEYAGPLPNLDKINAGLEPALFLGKKLNSTIGVPAGPLLNAEYIKLYADLGFDVLTYKTVRTQLHPSHPYPNVQAVKATPEVMLAGGKPTLVTLPDDNIPLDQLSITNSFGMPSRAPQTWQQDVAKAKGFLHAGQMLVVSVVGTVQAESTMANLAADFAQAAAWAKQAGADAVEANLSCPNVQSGEGSLYQSPAAVRLIAQNLKASLGELPFLLKIGALPQYEQVLAVAQAAWEGGAAGLAAINTIPANVIDSDGKQALPGQGRLVSGICGAAIKPAGLAMVKNLQQARQELDLSKEQFVIVGVGGIMTAADAFEYYQKGADSVQSGTGAMWNPELAQQIKLKLSQ
jgi:dihydroorotate dehydrogenase